MENIVWLVETGEYEQRYIVGVYESYDAAIGGIKRIYKHPYIVKWEMDGKDLIGHFDSVPHYSVECTGTFTIEPYPVQPTLCPCLTKSLNKQF